MHWIKAPRTPGRVAGAIGAAGLAASLWLTWFYDRTVVPNAALDAWENYARTDLLLALLALAALAGSALAGSRASIVLRVTSGALAVAVVARAFAVSDPGRGARAALLAGLLVAVSPAIDLAHEAWRARRPRARGTGPDRGERLMGGALRAAEVALPIGGRLWRIATLTPILAIPIALIALPPAPIDPGGGTDGSWITGLYVAAHKGLPFGTDFVYTYGPLGYLSLPRLYYADLTAQAFAYVALAYYAVAVTFLWAARRSFPLVPAAVVTLLLLECFRIVGPDEQTQFAVLAMAFAWAVALLRTGGPTRARWAVPLLVALALFAGMEAMIKLNAGATIAGTLAVAAVAVASRRLPAVAAVAVAFPLGLVAVWLAIGQPLDALPDYLRSSYETIVGYPESQYTEEGGREWEYLAVPLVLGVLGWTAWTASAGWPALRRVALFVITAAVAFSAFKQGFTRHDGHSIAFFATVFAMAVAIGWRRGGGALPYFAVAALFLAYLGASRPLPFVFHQPRESVTVTLDHLRTIRDPDAFIAKARETLLEAEDVPEEALRHVRGHTFHGFPTETALAWAYPDLDWAPLPIIQGFQAYTPHLDGQNAARLRSKRAPERLLRTTEFSPFEQPRTTLEVVCRYREVFTGKKWQVLARMPSRCGAPRQVAVVKTRTGDQVPVPRTGPDELLYMRLRGFEKHGLESLRALLWKPYDRVMVFGREDSRLNGRLLEEPKLLRIPRRFDHRPPFRMSMELPPEVSFLAGSEVLVTSQRRFADMDLTVEFYAVPLARPVRAPSS